MIKLANFSSIFIANWKLNGNIEFIKEYYQKLIPNSKNCIVICSPNIYLNQLKSNITRSPSEALVTPYMTPGGKAMIYDWVKQPLSSYLGDAELDNDQLQHFREHCLLSAADLEFLFKQAGFKVLERIDRRSGRFCMLVVEKSER